jgi:hypothetical protein
LALPIVSCIHGRIFFSLLIGRRFHAVFFIWVCHSRPVSIKHSFDIFIKLMKKNLKILKWDASTSKIDMTSVIILLINILTISSCWWKIANYTVV